MTFYIYRRPYRRPCKYKRPWNISVKEKAVLRATDNLVTTWYDLYQTVQRRSCIKNKSTHLCASSCATVNADIKPWSLLTDCELGPQRDSYAKPVKMELLL